MMEHLTPYKATHPGEVLGNELTARNIRQKDFAMEIGMKFIMFNEIVKGKRSVTADVSILFEEALEISADFWLKFQIQYDLDSARIKNKNIQKLQYLQIWKQIKTLVPIRYFNKAGLVSTDIVDNINRVRQIYCIETIEDLQKKMVYETSSSMAYYRKSDKLRIDEKNLFGWKNLVRWQAESEIVNRFNPDCFNELKTQLQSIIYVNQNTREKVRDLLASYGIIMICQEKFDKTPIDGYTFWSGENPAIAMTLRHKRIDNFAFTLFHELGHVFLHLTNDRQATFLDLEGTDRINTESSELEADDFAKEALIPNDRWESLIRRTPLNDNVILDFAQTYNVHPAIPLGRLLFENNNYSVKTNIDRRLC